MPRLMPYCLVCLLAGLAPMIDGKFNFVQAAQSFPGWPVEINGKAIRQLPLSERESYFLKSFPGRIGRFTDGDREYIVRWLTQATRKLHSASDCLRGVGYTIDAFGINADLNGRQWRVFHAKKDQQVLRISERFYDEAGNSWIDVSSWYWAAMLDKSQGPWWSITIAENTMDSES